MRVAQVEAIGFGPLNGAALDFGEGLTLVFGPNEAGKSSWHNALYAGVCGIRRARGPRSELDREFELQHRPWDGGPWKIRAVVELAGGRRIELTQDLAARRGTAIDLATGRDVTNGILNGQVPDASHLLGLDRDAFRAVACVPQTALLLIRQQSGQLAEHLQRAAATAGTDSTAAEAIKRIKEFLAEQVGTDRAWTKPLAKAKTDLRIANEDLAQAEQTHADLAQLREQLHEAREAKEAAERQLRVAEAADARHRAGTAHDKWSQAAKLVAKYPEPPAQLAADDALAQQARVAVDGFRRRLEIPTLEGPSGAQLDAELAKLPRMPAGDAKPAPDVEAAYRAVGRARATLQSVTDLQPPFGACPERTPEQTSELRRLADALAEPLPATPHTHARRGLHPDVASPAISRLMLSAGGFAAAILVIAGVVVTAVARQPTGWAAVVAGAVTGAVLLLAVLRGHAHQIAALRDLHVSGTAAAMQMAAERRLADARTQLAALGLPADPRTLRELADTDDQARATASQWNTWQANRTQGESNLQAALDQLSRELSGRGVPVTRDPEDDLGRYLDECARRGELAADAARRPGLQSQLRDRLQAEKQAVDAADRRSAAERELRAAASACQEPNATTATLDELADALEEWLEQRGQTIGEHQQVVEEYAILQQLLGGGTIDEMMAESSRLSDSAQAAADGLDPDQIACADLGSDPMTTLKNLQAAARDAREKVTELQTKVDERQRRVLSVAEAKGDIAQASARVGHLERLSRILGTTHSLLVQAQDNVHQSIAPQLANAIAPHLGAVTAGRYTEATVDPDDLQVRVRAPGGPWRVAERLSHGTAEQVYLLLRAALAQYLPTTREPCPLILDDPTAYADHARTTTVLRVLHHVSTERQVIVFSHDTQALAWARGALNAPRDQIIELAS